MTQQPQQLSAAVLAKMRGDAERVQQETKMGNAAYPRFDLTGKNALIQPGQSEVIRVMPRWDYAQRFVKGADGKYVPNDAYVEDVLYKEGFEHWMTRQRDNQRMPVWCPRTWSRGLPCPLCEAAAELGQSSDDEEVKEGRDLAAKGVFLYNVIAGAAGQRKLTGEGLVDIRVLAVPASIYLQIVELMTGGGQAGFACGDVSHIESGYDLLFTRPVAGVKNARWTVKPARFPSAFATKEEAPAFRGWATRLVQIPDVLTAERRTYEQLYTDYWGAAPDTVPAEMEEGGTWDDAPAEIVPERPTVAQPEGFAEFGSTMATDIAAEGEGGGDDDDEMTGEDPFNAFGFDPAAEPAAAPAAVAPAPAVTAAPRTRRPAAAPTPAGRRQPPKRR